MLWEPNTLVAPADVLVDTDAFVASLGVGVQTRVGAAPVVSVRGELDLATAERFWEFLYAVIDTHGPDVVVDLSDLAFCDAHGLSAFVRAANRAEAAGGRLTLVAPRPLVARVLRITGLDRRFLGSTDASRRDRRSLAHPGSRRESGDTAWSDDHASP